nr:MAG TPA: Transcriptional regulator, RHH-like, CopG [Caudoviricetes sp.]
MKEKLQKAADAENRTLTNYIENIIIKALKEEG